MDGDALRTGRIGADRGILAVAFARVSCGAQLLGDVLHRELLSWPQFGRCAIDFRRSRKERLLQALVNNALVFEVIEAEDAGEDEKNTGDSKACEYKQLAAKRGLPGGAGEFNFYSQIERLFLILIVSGARLSGNTEGNGWSLYLRRSDASFSATDAPGILNGSDKPGASLFVLILVLCTTCPS